MRGNVKRFNQFKGFGFIYGDDGNDYFFHYSQLMMDGYKTIRANESVEFTPVMSERGPQAHDIMVIKG